MPLETFPATMGNRNKRQLRAASSLNLDLFRPDNVQVPAPATLYSKITRFAEVSPVPSLVDRHIPVNGEQLPSEEQLCQLFDHYNWLYFRGRLRRPRIEYSSRMTTAGAFFPKLKLIRISRRYHELFPEEIADTLKHEMIHLVHLKHDASFQAEAKRIGASVKARTHPLLGRPPTYVYECPSCGTDFPRQKRLVMASCGYCSKGGQYDRRYKLVLVRSLKKK
ncbi:MAG: SprT-like domain-containing protein [Candidatus Zixiibacteriota bacterium]